MAYLRPKTLNNSQSIKQKRCCDFTYGTFSTTSKKSNFFPDDRFMAVKSKNNSLQNNDFKHAFVFFTYNFSFRSCVFHIHTLSASQLRLGLRAPLARLRSFCQPGRLSQVAAVPRNADFLIKCASEVCKLKFRDKLVRNLTFQTKTPLYLIKR